MSERIRNHRYLNEHAGSLGWAALSAGVVAWDLLAPETLSGAADRYLESERLKYVAYAVGGIVAGHVLNVIPDRFDPIHRLAEAVGAK